MSTGTVSTANMFPTGNKLLAVTSTAASGKHRLSIYQLSGTTAGQLAEVGLAAPPQCLIVDPKRGILVARAAIVRGHALEVFSHDLTLTKLHHQRTFPIPVHLARAGAKIAVSHFWQGQVSVHNWHMDGSLELVEVIEGFGSSVHKRQRSTHAHSSLINGEDIYIADFGADAVRRYRNGALEASWTAPPGAGPRHMALLPSGVIALVTELTNAVHLLAGDNLCELGPATLSLPETFTAPNQASDIQYVPETELLLVGHRGLNALVIHRVDSDCAPVLNWLPLRGAPRVIAQGPDGLMAVACEDNGWVQIFEPDGTTFRERLAFQPGTSATALCFLDG